MQTFLPYASFKQSAQCLDNKRLGKQRVEVLQILNALTNSAYGWQNHPAVKMWRGNESALAQYGLSCCLRWISLGFKDTCANKIVATAGGVDKMMADLGKRPAWLGNEAFHASHRSNLLRKDLAFYSQFGWTEPNDLPYVWPV